MNAFFSEHRLLAFRGGPEVPPESPEPTPESHPERVPHAPIAMAEQRFRMITGQTLESADSLRDPVQRERMRQQTADIQRSTGERLQRVAQDVERDVMNEAA